MLDTCQVIPVIEGDWVGRPVVKFGGDRLYSVCVSEHAFAPSRGYVSRADHVYCFYLWCDFFSVPQYFADEAHPRLRLVSPSPCVRRLAYRPA